ncbi:MAG: NAD(P)-dependent oxidoreductase [Actinomycetota bacterium]|nr:NAD(P)-dependent oxidoreductase [Actinomycetota bacterium]
MRVLVTGGTGVIGRQLTPLLASVGHEVIALTRSGASAPLVQALGGRAVIGDLLDRVQVARALRTAQPEAIVHMATAIPAVINPRRLSAQFATTNLLRSDGTRYLLEAATDLGVQRFIAQGLAYAYDPAGDGPAAEREHFWRDPPKQFAPVLTALRELEQRTVDAGGVVLRLGHLYGPGSIYSAGGSFAEQVRAGKVPLIGGGTAVFSFTHAHDAATAVVAALDRNIAGPLNVVDDEPAPMSVWLPQYSKALAARPPKTAPAAVARLAVGGWGVAFMTQLRGADNALAKAVLDWKPRFASWRTGLAEELAQSATTEQRG